ncbi:alpha/beta hydrolase family esterase [Sulfitobacter donghicola]|uniref:Polyhydroxybutyrate depolymerase n=1 Tax=Sulfitobacter donghicola DSW-25 = KCTC 12864 = JCM 14565 TaxID=1300350 RepID=A0A073IFI9_9RHOB|nr:polyhydroxybutyrate depolymerase [Sulfitobacter donghicola]KEJ89103.1 polyhydroxybutyrate depolymerase [Sulfitobacter donghicola DSW-25 = KCTC 12864 = JCM 14565]KIN67320.1 putative polyhydroxybutyrate depolymerase [Sulfitobacter donghicola DSW-25 = KCTC 12864 = JCM 14565]
MRYVLVLILMVLAPSAYACGEESDCQIGDRVYRISMPEGTTAPKGALVWAHGYRGTAAGVMRNGSLKRMVHERGMALIAVQARDGLWKLPNGPRSFSSTGAEEFRYFDAVAKDAQRRFGIDPAESVMSGFSAGGMMVWNLACARPERFSGFIPIAGTYWLQPPESCTTPTTSIVHLHGDRDGTVPLDGREIGATRQGKVSEALADYTRQGAFGPVRENNSDMLRCQERSNADGEILEFCLFEGGHSFRTEYLSYGLDRLKAAGQL